MFAGPQEVMASRLGHLHTKLVVVTLQGNLQPKLLAQPRRVTSSPNTWPGPQGSGQAQTPGRNLLGSFPAQTPGRNKFRETRRRAAGARRLVVLAPLPDPSEVRACAGLGRRIGEIKACAGSNSWTTLLLKVTRFVKVL